MFSLDSWRHTRENQMRSKNRSRNRKGWRKDAVYDRFMHDLWVIYLVEFELYSKCMGKFIAWAKMVLKTSINHIWDMTLYVSERKDGPIYCYT